jgi:hypothetical protein
VVTILSPTPGATVSGVYTINVSATSPLGAPTISYQIDSGFLNVPNTSSSVQWDSTTVANGPHTLAVFGTDRLGHTTIANVAFSVNNTVRTALSVAFASPANGAAVSGVATFTATAAGNSGPVGFRLDNTAFPAGSIGARGASQRVELPRTFLWMSRTGFRAGRNLARGLASAEPMYTAGVQFATVFHVPEPGFVFQVALPAKAAVAAKNMSTPTPWSGCEKAPLG